MTTYMVNVDNGDVHLETDDFYDAIRFFRTSKRHCERTVEMHWRYAIEVDDAA